MTFIFLNSLYGKRIEMTPVDSETVDDDVIALAGIYQAAGLVKQAARAGNVDAPAFRTSIDSVFRFDADTAESVYGGLAGLKHGLSTLAEQLDKRDCKPDPELAAYAAHLMFLERKLSGLPWMLQTLRQEIEAASQVAEQSNAEDQAVIANLAHAYSQTISRLNPRILVHGDPELLKHSDVANRVRALLLAGMRAAVLWRQVGGSRLRLLFGRKRIVSAAQMALSAIEG